MGSTKYIYLIIRYILLYRYVHYNLLSFIINVNV